MMKKIYLLFLIAALSFSAFAQNEKALKKYRFQDNWFIQLQGGATYTFSESSSKTSFGKLITPAAAISLGKYFSPEMGFRINAGGWEAKSYLPSANATYNINYVQGGIDGLLDITNLFRQNYENNVFNLVGILGVDYLHGFPDHKSIIPLNKTNMIVPRAGLQADFNLSEAISLNLEAVGNLLADRFNGRVEGKSYDGTASLLAGISYKFPERGFKTVNVIDPSVVKSLNDKVNDLRSELDDKNRKIEKYESDIANLQNKQPKTIYKEGQKETVLNALVVFTIGKAVLEKNQEINIYNAAKYLQENPDVKIIVTGYADRNTGTPQINSALSEKRAQVVADILTNKYGISPDRIETKASGDKVQPFNIPEWNRVVIFTAVE